ncbi:tetratricopeptide repeat protein [Tahibacter amnicola]|uniref:Sel1 repeat-containing protein n=1 Tax=Tahibacter amnicola TaxID=2976241 RepID=A0ABY6BBN8_9GAMM|nr:hypothetical protein [Tahibacter amnicola]UXI66568.1 hypothetical protein N4264_17670 [Tahibacter amnicola]
MRLLKSTILVLLAGLFAAAAVAEIVPSAVPRDAEETPAVIVEVEAEAAPGVRSRGIPRRLLQQANGGNVEAMLAVALAYYRGDRVTRSYVEAARWLDQARHQGDWRAAVAWGYLASEGRGMPRNPDAARTVFSGGQGSGVVRAWLMQAMLERSGSRRGLDWRQLVETGAERGIPSRRTSWVSTTRA